MDSLFALSVGSAQSGLLAVLAVGLMVGMAWLTEDLLVKNLIALGVLDSLGNFNIRRVVNAAAATQTLTALMNTQTFVGAVDAVFTLPKAATGRGLSFTFINGALSAGVGMSISPNAADFIGGYGLTETVDKDLIDSGATDAVGDQVTVTENAAGTGWIATNKIGTFAKQA